MTVNRKSIAECEAFKKVGEEERRAKSKLDALEFYLRSLEDSGLRESIRRQNEALQNIAPGSPLYDRVMGVGQVESIVIDQQAVNKRYAAFVEAGAHPVKHLLKTILRQAAYFVGVMLLVAVVWAVLS